MNETFCVHEDAPACIPPLIHLLPAVRGFVNGCDLGGMTEPLLINLSILNVKFLNLILKISSQ